MNNKDNATQILADIKRSRQLQTEMQEDTIVVKTAKQWYSLSILWSQITTSLWYIWNKFISPVYSSIFRLARFLLWKPFRKIWDKTVYYTDKKGERRFSKVKGSINLLSTFVFILSMYQVMFIAFDFGLYLATVETDEVVYLSNAQEIDADTNLHSAQGCIAPSAGKDFSCDADNSLYFRIDGNYFNQIWSRWHHNSWFYPDYVAAPIAPGWHVCTITSYGLRLKFMMRNWDIYPYLLSASCGGSPT